MIQTLLIGIILIVGGVLLSLSHLEFGLPLRAAFRRHRIWAGLSFCILGALLILSLFPLPML